jgi:chemotaxis protein CheC
VVEDFNKLSSIQLDALCETANIGAGHAATALATLLNTKIEMSVPRARILPFTEVSALMGGAETHVLAIYFHVSGPVPVSILFVMTIDKARQLVEMLLGNPCEKPVSGSFTDLEFSAMMELGNILSSTYLNALATFINIRFQPSVPALAVDMAGAILNAILAQYGDVADQVLVLEAGFKKEDMDVVGNLFLLPGPGSLEMILSSLGVNI